MKRSFVVPIMFAVLLVACSGGDDPVSDSIATLETAPVTAAVSTTTTVAFDMEAAAMAAVECFRDQGIDLPDPTVDANGNIQFSQDLDPSTFDEDAMAKAQQECSGELSQVITGFVGTDLTGLQDQLLEYAQCMRENGFDLPDPDFSGFAEGGLAEGPFGGIDEDDPDFLAANDVCESILADLLPGS